MDPNTHSVERPGGLDRLAAVVEELAAEDLDYLTDAEAARRVLVLRKLVDRLEGQFLRELAAVDGRGAAGTEVGAQAPSTVGWLRGRLRAGRATANGWVQTARALYRGPLAGTAAAVAAGDISPRHATVLAYGTHDLPAATATEAEPVLLQTAVRVDPPQLRKVITYLRDVADPDGADARTQRQQERRGLWASPTLEGMVAIDGLLDPEAGETMLTWPAAPWKAAGCQTPAGSAPRSPSPSTWPACSATPGYLAGRGHGPGRCPLRRRGGWPATPP
jgi:hypothetical protein